jgi:hypothetical protein
MNTNTNRVGTLKSASLSGAPSLHESIYIYKYEKNIITSASKKLTVIRKKNNHSCESISPHHQLCLQTHWLVPYACISYFLTVTEDDIERGQEIYLSFRGGHFKRSGRPNIEQRKSKRIYPVSAAEMKQLLADNKAEQGRRGICNTNVQWNSKNNIKQAGIGQSSCV